MNVGLRFVTEKGVTTAHAAVTGATAGKKGGRAEVWVIFSVDGKAKNPVVTEKGLASLVLKGLKPGRHTVTAEIVGDGATDNGVVTVKASTVGLAGGFFMALYWVMVLYYGYPYYTVTALAATMAVLVLVALVKRDVGTELWEEFLYELGNNNWVLRTAFGMLLGVFFLWWMDSTAPEITFNPIKLLWNFGTKLVSTPLEDPLGRTGFGGTINSFFFGKGVIGWGVVIFHAWAAFWAIWVSKWDEVLEVFKGIGSKAPGMGLGKLVFGETIAEAIVKILALPFRIFK